MTQIDQIFIKFDLNGKSTVTIESLLSTTTIKELKDKVADKEGSAMIEGVRLIYAGKQLSKNNFTLADYNIQRDSTLFAVLRLRGGSNAPPSPAGAVYEIDDEKVGKLQNVKIGNDMVKIKVTNGDCEICSDTKKLAILHNNHSICAECMYNWVRAKVYNGNAIIKCPISCQKEIPPIVAFTVAGLSTDEWEAYELQINQNAVCFKACPNNQCRQFIIKEIKGMRVKCPKCTGDEFCWACLDKWNGNDNVHCGNAACSVVADALREIQDSWDDRANHGKIVSNIVNVPLTRVCTNPGCLRLNEYAKQCKHITCGGKSGCCHQYCHVCLRKWSGCKCAFCQFQGNNVPVCSLATVCPVAALQTFF